MASRKDIEAGRAHVVLGLKNQMEGGLRGAQARLLAFGKSLKTIGGDLQSLGTKMTAIGTAIAAPLGLAVQRFAGFDDAMRAVKAVSQSTDVEFGKLTATAKHLGATTSYTAVQVASLMTELGRAGFSAAQIETMTGAVLALARATGTDATLASGIMAASIRQFGLGAEEATRVADALTVAANKSFNTVEQLGEALSYAGPVAADFGMSIEDTLAILGGLGNMGIQASNAGTAIRRLLTLTGAESAKMQGIFGVAFADAAGNARPLLDVLEDVNTVTKDMGSADRAAKFNEAFGLLGITAASSIGKSIGSIRELREALGAAEGAAAKAAKEMDAGLGGAFRILRSAVEGVAIGIGEALAPKLQQLAELFTAASGKILEFVKANQSRVLAIAAVTVAAIAGGVALIGFGSALSAVGVIATFTASVLGGLATVVGLIATPIGAIAAAGAALAGVFAAVSGVSGYLTTQLGTVWLALKGLTQLLVGGEWGKAWEFAKLAMSTLASAALDLFSQLPKMIAYTIGRVARGIMDAIGSTVVWIGNTMKNLFSALLSAAAQFGRALVSAMVTGDWSGVSGAISGAMSSAMNAAKGYYGAMGAGWNKEGSSFQSSARTQALQRQMGSMLAGPAAKKSPGQEIDLSPTAGRAASQPTLGATGMTAEEIAKIREEVIKTKTPLESFAERTKELQNALSKGAINGAEFAREIKAAREELIDPSPIQAYTDRIRELKDLLAAGLIDEKAFRSEALEALPSKVQQIIDDTKTPLQKMNEELAEAGEFLRAGLLTQEQFAAFRTKLQGVETGTTAEGGTFSAAAAMANLGGRIGRPEEKTAENTAAMRKILADIYRATRYREGLAFG